MKTNRCLFIDKKYISLLVMFIFTAGLSYAQTNDETIEIDSLDYEKIIMPGRFQIIENTSFELHIDTENYTHPIKAYKISSRFGLRNVKYTNKYEMGIHRGIDILADEGTPVYAMFDGVVRISKNEAGGYGKIIIIRHKNGLESLYAHLDYRYVKAGQKVYSGSCIGLSGNTGISTGPHLHLELSTPQGRFDPELLIDFATGKLKHTND